MMIKATDNPTTIQHTLGTATINQMRDGAATINQTRDGAPWSPMVNRNHEWQWQQAIGNSGPLLAVQRKKALLKYWNLIL
jgi:hypothetical protein